MWVCKTIRTESILLRSDYDTPSQASLGAPLWNCAILTPNSQICVALMVSAPIHVAQKQMSYLRDPQEQNRGLWVGY